MATLTNDLIKQGDELMVFMNGKSIAFATSHSLSLSSNTLDIASKDHGYWGASKVGKLSWEITSENLYTDEGYDALQTAWANKTEVTLVWGKPSDYTAEGIVGTAEAWTAPTAGYYTGKAIITSLSVNAATGDNATFSATFTGVGPFEKKN